MAVYIITKDNFGAALLKRTLPPEFAHEVEFVVGGSGSAAISMARSLLVRRQMPVVLVLDADSVDPNTIRDRQDSATTALLEVSINTPVKVILVAPELEALFFERRGAILSHLLDRDIPERSLNLAVSHPRQALEELLSESEQKVERSQLVDALSNKDVAIVRESAVMQELIQFLRSTRSPVVA